MRKLLITTALLAVAGSPAMAQNAALTLWNASNPGGAETATGTDTATISSSSLSGVTITTSAIVRETVPNNGITESNITITNNTSGVQVLDIIGGANGFLGPNSAFNASATVLIGSGQAELTGMFFVDPGNTLNGVNTGPVVGTQIGGTFDSGLLTGPFSFSSNSPDVPFSVTGTYGMAERLELTLQPGAFVGVQSISMDAVSVVPELRTWSMSLLGFGLLAAMGWRRRKHALGRDRGADRYAI